MMIFKGDDVKTNHEFNRDRQTSGEYENTVRNNAEVGALVCAGGLDLNKKVPQFLGDH
jgi:hypothetical protein